MWLTPMKWPLRAMPLGNNVWNRISYKLKRKRIRNGPDMLIRADNVFDPIVDRLLFDAAQVITCILCERGTGLRSSATLNVVALELAFWKVRKVRCDAVGQQRSVRPSLLLAAPLRGAVSAVCKPANSVGTSSRREERIDRGLVESCRPAAFRVPRETPASAKAFCRPEPDGQPVDGAAEPPRHIRPEGLPPVAP